MIVTIMQPAYLPWLGFFDRVANSDLFIYLDHVLISRRDRFAFTNRNRIRTKEGWHWLTVPIKSKGKHGALFINETAIVKDQWAKKHWMSIQQSYKKSKFLSDHSEFFGKIYSTEWIKLVDLNLEIASYLFEQLSIKTKILRSSEMNVSGEKDELILNLCKEVNAEAYISGPFGRDYLDLEKFTNSNIDVLFHDYEHPKYTQSHDGFEPYMSAIDLLFNYGEESLNILRSTDKL